MAYTPSGIAHNLPSGDSRRVSFGPGILKLSTYAPSAAGGTPSVDVGYVRSGGQLTISREIIELLQGSPRKRVGRWASAENVQFTISGVEWNLNNLAYALGVGTTTLNPAAGGKDSLTFGGSMDFSDLSLLYEHRLASGYTTTMYIWRCSGAGEVNITTGDDIHEFPMTFIALEGTSNWTNGGLAVDSKLFKIDIQK